jgi:glycosyltransferase involved in cell wall biosynthesis
MKFTIAIPTRNRGHLLPNAIASALAQTFGDFELLISNNDSTDATQSVIDAQTDPRIRGVRTDKALSMVDHWNWVIAQARGDWVLYLCDDDALTPDALETLVRTFERHPGEAIVRYAQETYYYDDGIDAEGNMLKFRSPRPRGVVRRSSARQLRHVYTMLSGDMPKVLNAAVRRELIDDVRREHGRLFHPWAPDYTAGVLMLSRVEGFLDLRTPLLVWGKNRESYGSGSAVDPDVLMQFLKEFPEFTGRYKHVEIPDLFVIATGIGESLHLARELALAARPNAPVPRVNAYTMALMAQGDIKLYQRHNQHRWDAHMAQVDALRRSRPLRERLDRQLVRLERHIERWREKLAKGGSRTLRVRGTPDNAAPSTPPLFTNIAQAAAYYTQAAGPG